ncbi:RNA-directed DNA polymerase, eukaryota [Tanacetum coccineum]
MDLRNKIDKLDMKAETSYLSTVEVKSRTTLVKLLVDIEYGKVKDLKKAKTRWALEGDENTSFFHGIINNRNRSRINGLNVQGEWVSDAMSIKNHVFHFFSTRYKEVSCSRQVFKSNLFKRLSFDEDFETSSYIPRGCNSSFITLVPKLEDPLVIGDFRPISLIECQYKIVAKVLANRLSKVISSVVAFASVLINGSSTKKFKLERGLRQGDPLSPFLFILAAKALNVAILEATNHNIFHGIKVGKDKLHISHLQYADDALILEEWSLTNAKNLSMILTCFHLASGLKVNFNKSKLYGIGGMYHSSSRPLSSGTWSRICNLKNDLSNFEIELSRLFKKKAGNGRNISFWYDNWIGGATLQDSFR